MFLMMGWWSWDYLNMQGVGCWLSHNAVIYFSSSLSFTPESCLPDLSIPTLFTSMDLYVNANKADLPLLTTIFLYARSPQCILCHSYVAMWLQGALCCQSKSWNSSECECRALSKENFCHEWHFRTPLALVYSSCHEVHPAFTSSQSNPIRMLVTAVKPNFIMQMLTSTHHPLYVTLLELRSRICPSFSDESKSCSSMVSLWNRWGIHQALTCCSKNVSLCLDLLNFEHFSSYCHCSTDKLASYIQIMQLKTPPDFFQCRELTCKLLII